MIDELVLNIRECSSSVSGFASPVAILLFSVSRLSQYLYFFFPPDRKKLISLHVIVMTPNDIVDIAINANANGIRRRPTRMLISLHWIALKVGKVIGIHGFLLSICN